MFWGILNKVRSFVDNLKKISVVYFTSLTHWLLFCNNLYKW